MQLGILASTSASLATEWGSGRRRGKLGSLHLGARDPYSNSFVLRGKTLKGLTDATLDWRTRELLAREIGRSRYPTGLASGFARVKRCRQDKSALDAVTHGTVAASYQAGTQGQAS